MPHSPFTGWKFGQIFGLAGLLSLGNLLGQEPAAETLVLIDLEIDRTAHEGCTTIQFETDPGLQLITLATCDFECWQTVGFCQETVAGHYEYIDLGSAGLSQRYYQFYVFDPPVELPPQYEQLRQELGDEQFGQWLESNREQFGTYSGVSEQEVEEMAQNNGAGHQEWEDVERGLDRWLRQYREDSAPAEDFQIILPPEYESVRIELGDWDFSQFLLFHEEQWGNYQGICPPIIFEWEEEPQQELYLEFVETEWYLNQWLDEYLGELLLPDGDQPGNGEQPLPPQFEQLRAELGDEAFRQWLESNKQQTGTLQGLPEEELEQMGQTNPQGYEEAVAIEQALEQWLLGR
ncbi:MAG: hypothetical protein AAF191_13390 [Verrucomicrobiota bacterium]